jgi:integrase
MVPLPPLLANTLREWKLACPPSALDLAFANGKGKPPALADIVRRLFQPAQVAAGVTDGDGRAKYGGLHALRHFYASWCINRKVDGGLELPLTPQSRLRPIATVTCSRALTTAPSWQPPRRP